MSTLTILTRKSINKDQFFFISSGSLLERIDWLNNKNNSGDMASLYIFYSETDEVLVKLHYNKTYLLVFSYNLHLALLNTNI